MRFKNFINNFSKKNIIFSDEDMFNMSLGDIFDNEDELFSQYKAIGFNFLIKYKLFILTLLKIF